MVIASAGACLLSDGAAAATVTCERAHAHTLVQTRAPTQNTGGGAKL